MPSARIHESIIREINAYYNYDDLLLRIGTVSPDCWRNSGEKNKFLTHFWNHRIKSGEANDYLEFYLKYYNDLNNPFTFGYLVHLIVDQYWKTYISPKYQFDKDGKTYYNLKDGTVYEEKEDEYFGYHESKKIQKLLARHYNLGTFPINREEINNFECNIDELNLKGLFGSHGTLNYINNNLVPDSNLEESKLVNLEDVLNDIYETTNFVKEELKRLDIIKKENDSKIKIAIDIDDTILNTKELKDYYWNIYLNENPSIDPNKNYVWGDIELANFWAEYREKMAFGKVKDGVQDAINSLINKDYIVDLLSARPLDKYAPLKPKMVKYFEDNNINYNYLHLGFHSKSKFLKEHNYNILIDNDIENVKEASNVGVIAILYGKNDMYDGYQTDNWNEIPKIIDLILNKISKKFN